MFKSTSTVPVDEQNDSDALPSASRRAFIKQTATTGICLSAGASLFNQLVSSPVAAMGEGGGAPYFFHDYNNGTTAISPASYTKLGSTYRFPASHRLAPSKTSSTMETMQRSLLRLFVRCDYDYSLFLYYLNHDFDDLILPVRSRHIKFTGQWLYPNGAYHAGVDFNNRPFSHYDYPDNPALSNFDIVAAADGTVVSWDGLKLLTLEHVSNSGQLFRTFYNMTRNAPIIESGPVIEVGRQVNAGELIGESWDPPGNPIHLHFGLNIRVESPANWRPDGRRLFDELQNQFQLTFSDADQRRTAVSLGFDPTTLATRSSWPQVEWYSVDPFGIYGINSGYLNVNDYAPMYRGAYYPIPEGIGTYAFRNPSKDRIPYQAISTEMETDLPVQAISLGVAAALFE